MGRRSGFAQASRTDYGAVEPRMPRPGTKQAALIAMLQRDHGASIKELVLETGWKANTVHSALTTLRKSGWAISIVDDRGKRYKIVSCQDTILYL